MVLVRMVMLPANSEGIKTRFELAEYDDDDCLVIVDSKVNFIG